MIDFQKIYYLGSGGKRTNLVVSSDELFEMDRFKLFRGDVEVCKPIKFEWYMGSRATDFLDNSFVVPQLISERVKATFTANNFRGWTTFPVEVHGKDGNLLAGYHGLIITGRCGRIDNSRSKMVKRPPKIPGKASEITTWIGLYFDPASWDGSDIFLPEGTGQIFVKQAVKDALEAAKLSNLYFERITEVERLVLT